MNGKCFLSRGIFAREKLEQIRKIIRKLRNAAKNGKNVRKTYFKPEPKIFQNVFKKMNFDA